MNDDALTRAKKLVLRIEDEPVAGPLVPVDGARRVPLADASKVNDALARARTLIEAPPKALVAAPPSPPRKPGPELVRLPMTCSARGGVFVVIAERHGNRLRFVGHEMPRARQDGEYQPGLLSGEYEIEFRQGWGCPLCQNDDAWLCDCAGFYGALHCCGSSGGRYHCACGRFEERNFVKAKKVQVRGASVAATPDKTRSQHGQQPQLKQVSYEPNR